MATETRQLIDEGAARLARASDSPRLDAELLLAAVLGVARSALHARADERILDCDATDRYEAYVTRRAHGEPVAYILGQKEFWSLTLTVTPAVLIPRPETELIVERALERLPRQPAVPTAGVLDLGTGSGAIAVAIATERPAYEIVGTDVSSAACDVARQNASRLGLPNVTIVEGSWYEPLAQRKFDVIVSNPPYIADGDARVERDVRRYEPPAALFAGPDGLAALWAVIAGAQRHLTPGGWLIVEHGDTQGAAVRELLQAAELTLIASWTDLAGKERCSEGCLPLSRATRGARAD